MDLNEINENQDGLFIFVAIVGIVLFIVLIMKAFEKRKKGDSWEMWTALFFAFLVLLIAIGSNYAIDDPSKRLVKFNLSFNSNEFKEAVVCYWGSVLNQHGVTVEAEREFQAFMNSCFISCSLPREERDPLKWDEKNIGKYFSL